MAAFTIELTGGNTWIGLDAFMSFRQIMPSHCCSLGIRILVDNPEF